MVVLRRREGGGERTSVDSISKGIETRAGGLIRYSGAVSPRALPITLILSDEVRTQFLTFNAFPISSAIVANWRSP